MQINSFSSNSLKVLDKSLDEFIDKYVYHLSLYKKDKRTVLGEKYHSLICAYIKGFDISKMMLELDGSNIEKFIKTINKDNFIKTEYPFLIKESLEDKNYYLTGRFDAIYKDNDNYIIYDWKTLNLPKNPLEDLQSVVYLYCLNKILKTDKLKIRYFSIENLNYFDVDFLNSEIYKNRLDGIIKKYYDN